MTKRSCSAILVILVAAAIPLLPGCRGFPLCRMRSADRTRAEREVLERKISFWFDDTCLKDVKVFLEAFTGQHAVLDAYAEEIENIPVTLKVENLPLEEALDSIAKAAGMRWIFYDHTIFIGSQKSVSRVLSLGPREKRLRFILCADRDGPFEQGEPIRGILRYLLSPDDMEVRQQQNNYFENNEPNLSLVSRRVDAVAPVPASKPLCGCGISEAPPGADTSEEAEGQPVFG